MDFNEGISEMDAAPSAFAQQSVVRKALLKLTGNMVAQLRQYDTSERIDLVDIGNQVRDDLDAYNAISGASPITIRELFNGVNVR